LDKRNAPRRKTEVFLILLYGIGFKRGKRLHSYGEIERDRMGNGARSGEKRKNTVIGHFFDSMESWE
jgi:hypothetical protein